MADQLGISAFQAYAAPKQTIKSLANSVRAKAEVFKVDESKPAVNGREKVAVKATEKAKDPTVLKAAKEFEASFLTAMLEQMWTGIEAEAPFGGGHAEKVYRSMVVGEYAKSISAAGGIGIADQVYREILSAQEGQS
jgi:Rod binding domain-containing protein